MTMRTVHLHVGLPKAASTSLQNALLQEREALGRAGFAYPITDPGQRFKRQRALTQAARGDSVAKGRLVAALQAVAADHHTLIISGEMVHLSTPEALHAILAEGGWGDARVLNFAIVRDPATWINSQYAFSAVNFMQQEEFSAFASRRALQGRCNWGHLLDRWIEVGDFTALPLRAVGDSRSVVARAFAHMGLAEPSAAPVENERVDPRTVEAALRIAERRFRGRRIARAGPLTNFLKAHARRREWNARFCGLDADIAARIAQHTAPLRNAFAMRVWGRKWVDVYDEPAPETFRSNEWRAVGGTPSAEIEQVVRYIESRIDMGKQQVA